MHICGSMFEDGASGWHYDPLDMNSFSPNPEKLHNYMANPDGNACMEEPWSWLIMLYCKIATWGLKCPH